MCAVGVSTRRNEESRLESRAMRSACAARRGAGTDGGPKSAALSSTRGTREPRLLVPLVGRHLAVTVALRARARHVLRRAVGVPVRAGVSHLALAPAGRP